MNTNTEIYTNKEINKNYYVSNGVIEVIFRKTKWVQEILL
jgi:hypothetical protein